MEEKETSKSRFEAEMTGKIDLIIQKLGGFETRFERLETDVSEIKSEVSELKQEVRNNSKILNTLSGQFNDVAVMAIEDNKRITKLETEVAELQSNIH